MLSWLRRLEHADEPGAEGSPPRLPDNSIRVLVVDDDARLRELLRTSF